MSTQSPSQAAPSYIAPARTGTNTLAIISLVSAFFVSLAAIITGHLALSQIRKTGESGRGLAITGLILGYTGVVVGLLLIVVTLVGAIVASSSYNY